MDKIKARRKRGFMLGAGMVALGLGMIVWGVLEQTTPPTRSGEWLPAVVYVTGAALAWVGSEVIATVKAHARAAMVKARARAFTRMRNGVAIRWTVRGHLRRGPNGDRWVEPFVKGPRDA